MDLITPEDWKSCVQHCIKLEDFMFEKEKLADDFCNENVTPFIIPLNESSDDDSENDCSNEDTGLVSCSESEIENWNENNEYTLNTSISDIETYME